MRRVLLAAALAIAASAAAHAQGPRQRADGLWVCPNDESRIIVNGDWRVLCYTDAAPTISMEEFKRQRDEYQRIEAANRERERKALWASGRCDEKRVPGMMYTRPPSCDDGGHQ